ncbi:hypothetical protein IW262DRAFT_306126 [Armillaria fumosa]|nr:hypothetical protein IW262DRAFT_306126 [Armillaria fumosa]
MRSGVEGFGLVTIWHVHLGRAGLLICFVSLTTTMTTSSLSITNSLQNAPSTQNPDSMSALQAVCSPTSSALVTAPAVGLLDGSTWLQAPKFDALITPRSITADDGQWMGTDLVWDGAKVVVYRMDANELIEAGRD